MKILMRIKNNIYFNGNKYYLANDRWMKTMHPQVRLAWDVWNYYNPSDQITINDGNIIHHINEITSDDKIRNLEKMKREEHNGVHQNGRLHSEKTKLRMSKNHADVSSENNPFYGKIHSEESKKKNSEFHEGKIISEETRKKISKKMEGNINAKKNKEYF